MARRNDAAGSGKIIAAYLKREKKKKGRIRINGSGGAAKKEDQLPPQKPPKQPPQKKGEAIKTVSGCAYCGVSEVQHRLNICTGCRAVRYCGRACQSAHWKDGHKGACSGGRSAAAAGKPPEKPPRAV